ncbi:SAP domain [Macleaya cordata]|uniref:SAP domain n=1 Tax=Macleaya cordata TaxID=56857 RepID=A0A200Q9G1_MACCD|nr:SAP domain [Macleaya cordata]
MRAMVESERLISSISSSSTSSPNNTTNNNKYKKLKRSIGDSVKKDDAVKIQTMKENSVELEGMTFQQLRTMSRNFGIPAKGSKHDLLLALKCFLDNEKDEPVSSEMRPSDPESTASGRKMKNLSSEDHSQNPNLESDVSLLQQTKRRRKPPLVDGATVEVNSKTVMTKQKLSVTTEGVPDKKPSRAQKKVISRTEKEDGGSTAGVGLSGHHSEPWTVLAHKKPQQGWIPYNPRTMRPPPLAADTQFVKLISWNVNGLRALLKLEGFSALQLAKRENFDVLCLQETKLQEKDVEEIKRSLIDGYENSFWTCSISKLGYSGTAIISRCMGLALLVLGPPIFVS